MKKKKYIICKKVKYCGIIDEEMFFIWIHRISCIESYEKIGDILYLYLKSKPLSQLDLYDILALLKRYRIDLIQLRQFLTKKNQNNFKISKDAYWYKPLFGEIKND